MGFLDIFKKKNRENDNLKQNQEETLPYIISMERTQEGNLQIDLQDNEADFKQFYNTTRVVINRQAKSLAGIPVYSCDVSWYSDTDAIMMDETGKENDSRTDYTNVLAEINLNELQANSDYCYAVMIKLLNRKRVEEYINRGMTEKPESLEKPTLPCGKYVGKIALENNRYKKYFDPKLGNASHYSQEMVEKRVEKRQQEIARREAKIQSLQSEIDKLR